MRVWSSLPLVAPMSCLSSPLPSFSSLISRLSSLISYFSSLLPPVSSLRSSLLSRISCFLSHSLSSALPSFWIFSCDFILPSPLVARHLTGISAWNRSLCSWEGLLQVLLTPPRFVFHPLNHSHTFTSSTLSHYHTSSQTIQSTNHFFPLFFFFSITWRRLGKEQTCSADHRMQDPTLL